MKIKRLLAVILAVVMLMGVLPIAELSASAVSYSTVRKGSKGETVKTLQTILNEVDNAGLVVDGSFGSATRSAVKAFQEANNLKVDGIVGPATWAALLEKYNGTGAQEDEDTAADYTGTLQKGDKNDTVKQLQIMLNRVCNADLDLDGSFGGATQRVVKKFQVASGISSDGIVGPVTWDLLEDCYKACVSDLKIGSGEYDPVTLVKGKSYSISGKITSSYKVTSVIAGVYKTNGTATSVLKKVVPNSKSYDISKVDKYLKFGNLGEGTYYFVVKATDASGTTKILVGNEFTVTVNVAAAFEEKALETWVAPLKNTNYYSIPNTIREFGSRRDSGARAHAGVDFTFKNGKGIPVYAMQSGKVVEYCSNFYGGMQAIAVQHADGSVARYCEISTSLRKGDTVTQGQQIAKIAKSNIGGSTMLHLEIYLGTASGKFTNRSNTTFDYVSGTKYERRRDIVNPEFVAKLINGQ